MDTQNLKNESIVQKLQTTLGKMELALGSILDGIVWTDHNGIIQWCNATFDRLVDKQHLMVLGKSIFEVLPLYIDRKQIMNDQHPLQLALKNKNTTIKEFEFYKKDQKLFLEINASSISDTNNQDLTGVLVIHEVTDKVIARESEKRLVSEKAKSSLEKNKAEEIQKAYTASLNIMADLDREKKKLQNEIIERQEIEHRLRQLTVSVEQSPSSIMITDQQGIIQYVNPKYFELTGYSQQEVLSKASFILQKDKWNDESHKLLWENLRRGKVWKGEFLNQRKNGESYWEYVIVSPVRDEQKQITNFLIIMQDITEQKKAEEQMKAAIEMKTEFTSTVSHELRTPLAAIKAAIDIVMSGTAGEVSSDQERFLGKAKANIDRLKRLIDDFLDLSKLEAGRMVLDFTTKDISEIVREVYETEKSIAEKKGLLLAITLEDKLPLVNCDSDRINQVLSNFVNNAIKFTESGEITITAKSILEDQYVQVCVSDTGEGIKKEDLPKVFEKFHQCGEAARRKTGGTGLGLAICQEIIQQHDGKIWVESTVGKGSQFYFQLPTQKEVVK